MLQSSIRVLWAGSAVQCPRYAICLSMLRVGTIICFERVVLYNVNSLLFYRQKGSHLVLQPHVSYHVNTTMRSSLKHQKRRRYHTFRVHFWLLNANRMPCWHAHSLSCLKSCPCLAVACTALEFTKSVSKCTTSFFVISHLLPSNQGSLKQLHEILHVRLRVATNSP